jgi:hypothetical protein
MEHPSLARARPQEILPAKPFRGGGASLTSLSNDKRYPVNCGGS